MSIRFNGKAHEDAFWNNLQRYDISPKDPERTALVYLLTITEDCRKHFDDCYDGTERCIKIDALQHGWVTSTDARAIRLAFNLYNDGVPTAHIPSPEIGHNLFDHKGEFVYDGTEVIASTPVNIFCDGSAAEFFVEALKIRFERF